MALIFVEDPLTLRKTAPKNYTSGLVKKEGQLCPKHLRHTADAFSKT
jgi:hypothetical protein